MHAYTVAMDYLTALRWLRTLPDFERTGAFSARPDLEPMRALLDELGAPHADAGRATVHVAGSKGKGSTAVIVEAMLGVAGLRTGCYVSPHLHRYSERVRIDGKPVDEAAFASAMTRVRSAMEAVAPRFLERQFLAFDALTAAAFVAFEDAEVDVQVVEVGLGGRLDSTNVFHENLEPRTKNPTQSREQRAESRGVDVCVITPISLEHTEILGGTIAEIAAEKAGIITPGAAVVVAPQRESAIDVVRARADACGATVVEVAKVCQMTRTSCTAEHQEFKVKTVGRGHDGTSPPDEQMGAAEAARLRREGASYSARLPLVGRHQLDNAATAIVACEELAGRRGFDFTPEHVRQGLSGVAWPGRIEIIKRKPLLIIDGAHNGDSAKRLAAALREHFGLSRAVLLFGTLAGKDITSMAEAMAPLADHVLAVAWPSPRAAEPAQSAAAFRQCDVPASAFGALPDALGAAMAQAGERGAVVAFGALAFVAAVREWVLGIESDMMRVAAADA